MRRRSLVALIAVLSLAATALPATATGGANNRTYVVTITNTTDSQWFTPPAVATHSSRFQLFRVGSPATVAVQEIAENGNLDAALGAFDASSRVYDSLVAFPDPANPGPLGPGESVTFEIEARRWARVSFASMLICSNDGFTGASGLRLPFGNGTATHQLRAYDAGTEANTEAWADLVPPCAQLSGFGDQGGTGQSNSAIADYGVVAEHEGILGIADLSTDVHGWSGPVATIEITRKR